MAKDYIEDESGAKFPLNYTFDGVNNFVFSTDVMFEDLQALCLGLASKLEAAQQSFAPDALPCEEEKCDKPAVLFYCEDHAP